MITLSKKLRPRKGGMEGEGKWGREGRRQTGGRVRRGELARAALRLDERRKDGIQRVAHLHMEEVAVGLRL